MLNSANIIRINIDIARALKTLLYLLTSLKIKQRDTIPADEGSWGFELKMPSFLRCFYFACSWPYQLKLTVSSVRLDNRFLFHAFPLQSSIKRVVYFYLQSAVSRLEWLEVVMMCSRIVGWRPQARTWATLRPKEDWRIRVGLLGAQITIRTHIYKSTWSTCTLFVELKFRAVRILRENQPG